MVRAPCRLGDLVTFSTPYRRPRTVRETEPGSTESSASIAVIGFSYACEVTTS
jgi:hypothetical protein